MRITMKLDQNPVILFIAICLYAGTAKSPIGRHCGDILYFLFYLKTLY